MSFVYDAGVFVAAERNDREVWADHRARLELGLIPRTTAPVVAQVSRSPPDYYKTWNAMPSASAAARRFGPTSL